MVLKYATTLQLNEILKLNIKVPSRDTGQVPSNEEVGTGDNSTAIFYLDQYNLIANTLILYYGATEPTATNTLTETTHYTINLETGKITLTAAGITLLDTNIIFAEYQYSKLTVDFSDAYLNDVLLRCEAQSDSMLNTSFTDGTATNPAYPSKHSIMPSQGVNNRNFRVENLPLIDVSSLLDANITDSDVTLDVITGEGSKFPTSGRIIIGSEVISYTGISTDTLTGLTRGVDSSTAAIHTAADSIHTTIFEISESDEGSVPSFETLSWEDNYYADENGNVYIYEGSKIDNIPQDIPNRIKIRYYYGYDSIPKDITRLTLLLAKRELIQDNIGKALVEGRNEFKPEMFNVDINEINRIVNAYKIYAIKNT